MRATADAQHNELMTALEDIRAALMTLAVIELMAQQRSEDAALIQVDAIYHGWTHGDD